VGGRDSSVSLFILVNNPNCSALALEQFYNYLVKFVRQNCVFKAKADELRENIEKIEPQNSRGFYCDSKMMAVNDDQVGWSIDHLLVGELFEHRFFGPMAKV
jgi:hypothetical protein